MCCVMLCVVYVVCYVMLCVVYVVCCVVCCVMICVGLSKGSNGFPRGMRMRRTSEVVLLSPT